MYPNPNFPWDYPGYDFFMGENPSQILAATLPLVRHGMAELRAGISAHHTLHEVAAAAYLQGMGYTAAQALAAVERWEEMGFLRERRR